RKLASSRVQCSWSTGDLWPPAFHRMRRQTRITTSRFDPAAGVAGADFLRNGPRSELELFCDRGCLDRADLLQPHHRDSQRGHSASRHFRYLTAVGKDTAEALVIIEIAA